jgi:biopolymer transport protein TolQ
MDIPVVEMVSRAGWVARLILALLGLFSIMTWAIIFNRMIFLGKASKGNKLFMRKYSGMKALTEIEKLDKKETASPVGVLGRIGIIEYKRILEDSHALTGVRDWSFILQNQFGMALERINTSFSEQVRKLDKGLIYLAISSSVAPFLGLLGTVWGIMNAFYQIGNQGSASLPVVAPGIAEALITTIIGLAVAIPAVLFYNYFVHRVELVENEMDEFKNLLLAHLKRDIFNVLYGKNKDQ